MDLQPSRCSTISFRWLEEDVSSVYRSTPKIWRLVRKWSSLNVKPWTRRGIKKEQLLEGIGRAWKWGVLSIQRSSSFDNGHRRKADRDVSSVYWSQLATSTLVRPKNQGEGDIETGQNRQKYLCFNGHTNRTTPVIQSWTGEDKSKRLMTQTKTVRLHGLVVPHASGPIKGNGSKIPWGRGQLVAFHRAKEPMNTKWDHGVRRRGSLWPFFRVAL